MTNFAAAVDLFPAESGGAELLRLALNDSVRKGREAGEIPTHAQEPSMPGDKPEVRLAGDTLDLLREEMRAAAKEGAEQAVNTLLTEDRAKSLFKVFFKVLREEMASGAGNWLLGGVWGGIKKAGGFILLVLILLLVGGPGLLKAVGGLIWDHLTGRA